MWGGRLRQEGGGGNFQDPLAELRLRALLEMKLTAKMQLAIHFTMKFKCTVAFNIFFFISQLYIHIGPVDGLRVANHWPDERPFIYRPYFYLC